MEKRSATAKQFDLGNGIHRLEAHVGHIHFRDDALKDGSFRDIDTTLEFNPMSQSFQMTKASYEAEIGLYGDVRFFDVDHSLEFRLPNPNRVQARSYGGSAFGLIQKALIWPNILQPGGHQIVEARNNSLAKIFHFERKPLSNVVEFQVIASAGVKFSDGITDFDLTKEASQSIKGRQGLFHSDGRLSWIRRPRAWNHHGEVVDVELQFFQRGNQVWLRKMIPQDFIDRTFVGVGAWLETDLTTSFYAGAGDGVYYRRGVDETWSNIRSGAQTGYDITSSTVVLLLSASYTSSRYENFHRLVFPEDTSLLGLDAMITGATQYLYCSGKGDDLGGDGIGLDHYTTAGYAIGNYSGVRQASDVLYANVSTVAYTAFALNATGLSNINKTGVTQIAARLKRDLDNSAPTWQAGLSNYYNIYCSEQAGTSNDPYLAVDYVPGFSFWNRNQISKPHYRM